MTAPLYRVLSILRPDDSGLSEETRWRIQVYRLLSLLGAVLVPLFGRLYRLGGADVVDPVWARVLLMAGFLGLVAGSYVSEWVRRRYIPLIQGLLYGVMTWFAVIAALNRMSGDYAIGLLFVFGVLSLCVGIGVDTPGPLVWFLGYGLSLTIAGCVSAPSLESNPFVLGACVASMAIVLYVVVRAQLSMQRSVRERTLLQRHVGAHTLEMIQDNGGNIPIVRGRGRMQALAVVFTDLRDSTDQIERVAPREFVRHLNRTFSTQAKIATHFGGSIDKFVGDAMIAIFDGHHALERALRCSIEIRCAFRTDPLSSSFWRGLGIGVNYGPMLMGTMGSEERIDYSIIGSEVNLGARLCDTASPGHVLVRTDLIERHDLTDAFRIESVGTHTFKGFDRQFEIANVRPAPDESARSDGTRPAAS